MLRCSSNLIKTHRRKLSKGLPGIFTRYSLASHPRHFSTKEETYQDLNNEFESFEDAIEPNYQDANVDEITKGDPELVKMLNLCQMEINTLAQSGIKVPSIMTTEYWRALIALPNQGQRRHYLRFLWSKQQKRKNEKRKKQENHQKYLEMKSNQSARASVNTNSPVKYGLNNTSLINRIRDAHINRLYNLKLLQSMCFGPHILVDCGYEPYMNLREINLCAKQLLFMWSENRDCTNPFDVIFCNLKENSPLLAKLRKVLVGIDTDPCFPFNYTEKNYLDLFPKENLVYLTPHCTETLDKFNGNDIYIIGALVDKSNSEPISLAKAKRDGIRFAKFPLDLYLNWKLGVKTLTLNQCLGIMNDVKDGRDWPFAFRHVPKRKLSDNLIDNETRELRETRHSAKTIRERYRRNLVYDLLLPTKKT